MVSFGARLRQERIRLGFTQASFAAISGQSTKTQTRYETDERSPDAEYLAAAAERGFDVLYILTGERRADVPVASASELPPEVKLRLRDAIEAIEEGLAATGRQAPPALKAELVIAAYDLLGEAGETATAQIIRLVNAA